MKKGTKRTTWTFAMVQAEAANYKTRGDFAKHSQAAYMIAYKRGWLDRLDLPKVSPKKWSLERLHVLVTQKGIHTSGALRQHNRSAYEAVLRNNWFTKLGLQRDGKIGAVRKDGPR